MTIINEIETVEIADLSADDTLAGGWGWGGWGRRRNRRNQGCNPTPVCGPVGGTFASSTFEAFYERSYIRAESNYANFNGFPGFGPFGGFGAPGLGVGIGVGAGAQVGLEVGI